MKKMPITKQGLEDLRAQLKALKAQRPSIVTAIAEAREHGDLSENAEYHAAREKQSFIEAKITRTESIISNSEVVDPKFNVLGKGIAFGATVVIACCETEKHKTYKIVGLAEADLTVGKVALSSPIAKALIGKAVGDVVTVYAPKGNKEYEILKISYD